MNASAQPKGAANSKRGGNSLGNLRRRARELNAELRLDSPPGEGTTVRLVVPLPAPPRV